MAQLEIFELSCGQQEDANLHDEVVVLVDAIPVSGPHNMATGDVINPGITNTFTGTSTVILIDKDRGNVGVPDFLGAWPVSELQAGQGDQEGHFHEAGPQYSYHMKYRVV